MTNPEAAAMRRLSAAGEGHGPVSAGRGRFPSAAARIALAASLLIGAVTARAQAEELKIGYVDGDRVLRDSAPAKAAGSKLEAEFSKRQKDLADVSAKLKAAGEKLEKDAATLSESERGRRQRELVDQDREFQRKQREFQEDLNQRRNEELASVIDRVNKIVKQIFDTEKYDLILQRDGVIFAGPKVDVTDKVIKALNAQPATTK